MFNVNHRVINTLGHISAAFLKIHVIFLEKGGRSPVGLDASDGHAAN